MTIEPGGRCWRCGSVDVRLLLRGSPEWEASAAEQMIQPPETLRARCVLCGGYMFIMATPADAEGFWRRGNIRGAHPCPYCQTWDAPTLTSEADHVGGVHVRTYTCTGCHNVWMVAHVNGGTRTWVWEGRHWTEWDGRSRVEPPRLTSIESDTLRKVLTRWAAEPARVQGELSTITESHVFHATSMELQGSDLVFTGSDTWLAAAMYDGLADFLSLTWKAPDDQMMLGLTNGEHTILGLVRPVRERRASSAIWRLTLTMLHEPWTWQGDVPGYAREAPELPHVRRAIRWT